MRTHLLKSHSGTWGRWWVASFISVMMTVGVYAQETPPTEEPAVEQVNVAGSLILHGTLPTDTWITTQDYLALRRGPGRAFEQITTVPAGLTLPAYGRTADTAWIQTEYEGQRGWLASRYLVWTGDVINLTVDGVDPEPFIRRAASIAYTTRETFALLNWDDPLSAGVWIPAGVSVELTGRIGDSGSNYYRNFFRVQLRYENNLYWVGSHDLRLVDGNYLRLLDLAYLFPYGRLYLELQNNLALAVSSYNQIEHIWSRLEFGYSIACDPIPPFVNRLITLVDVTNQPTFIPSVSALEAGINGINSAITAFRDACNNPAFTLTREYITTQSDILDDAYRNLLLSASLLEPLRVRNPLLESGS